MSRSPSESLAYASAVQQAAALAAGTISATELLSFVLARIDARDGAIHAVAVRNETRAYEAARAADKALARGEHKPLLGVPVTVKESFDVAGLATTSGNSEYAELIRPDDAHAVRRLRNAGAIIIGKTNVPVNLADWQSYNALYGTTNNPWNPARTPGGSSGGSAAALAAGYVALELGSDIGGSVRVPAHYTGVYAHKPTYGLVDDGGHGVPHGRLSGNGLSVIGPLARDAGDLALALDILAGPSAPAAKGYRLVLPSSRHKRLADFRVLVLDTHSALESSEAVRGAIDAFAGELQSAGARVARDSELLPDLVAAHHLYIKLLRSAALGVRPQPFYDNAVAQAARFSADNTSFSAVRARAALISHRDWVHLIEQKDLLRRQWEALFAVFDIVVTPVSPVTAFAHDHSEPIDDRIITIDGREHAYWDLLFWLGLATTPGLPATSLPLSTATDGLPVGVQAIGPYLEDRTTLAFARLAAEARGGFVAPPGF